MPSKTTAPVLIAVSIVAAVEPLIFIERRGRLIAVASGLALAAGHGLLATAVRTGGPDTAVPCSSSPASRR